VPAAERGAGAPDGGGPGRGRAPPPAGVPAVRRPPLGAGLRRARGRRPPERGGRPGVAGRRRRPRRRQRHRLRGRHRGRARPVRRARRPGPLVRGPPAQHDDREARPAAPGRRAGRREPRRADRARRGGDPAGPGPGGRPMSIAAVQSRMAEIQSAITAVSQPQAAPDAQSTQQTGRTATDFGGALATALGAQGLTGQSGTGLAAALGGLTGGGDTLPSLAAALTGTAGASALTGAAGAAGTPAATGGAATPGTGAALVESAKKYLGVPYVWGGESLAEGGLDCSGLVQ